MFSYIAKNDAGQHQCFVFLSDKMAENITLTIGEAFDLAYEKFIKKKERDLENQKQMLLLKKKNAELEEKCKILEVRLSKCNCSCNINTVNYAGHRFYLFANNLQDFLIPISPIPTNLPMIPTNGVGIDKNATPPPLPIAPPPRRASTQNSTNNILVEIFERKEIPNQMVQPANMSDLFDVTIFPFHIPINYS